MAEDIKKRNARQQAWQKENRDKINLLTPKGRKAKIQAVATAAGVSVTEWINQAITEKMERDGEL